MELYGIDENGQIEKKISLSSFIQEVCESTSEMYKEKGFIPPWIGYLAILDDQIVGTCAFKTPPKNGKVEIAYFTFPGKENNGIGTEMARQLVEIAKKCNSTIKLIAQTMPEKNASTRILEKLKFQITRTVNHPEDGNVWEWEMNDLNE